jgi:hypothetical protein
MQEAVITSTVDLTDSGCNACGLVEDTVYTLAIHGVDIPLDHLTVKHLVSAIVARNGFKQELVMDMMDEYVCYHKADLTINFQEEYDQLTYSNGSNSITTKNKIEDMQTLFATVNKVLTTLFEVEAVQFVIGE